MLQALYNLVNWQYFGVFLIIWGVVDLVWVSKWQSLLVRLAKLISKPVIFKVDKEPQTPPLYPREFLEQLALTSRRNAESLRTNATVDEGTMKRWVNAQRVKVFNPEHPIRSLGNVISFALFLFFLLADAIVVAATLMLMGVISSDIHPVFERLDIAILGGALLSTVVGVWMLVEMSGRGELVNTDNLEAAQKKIYKIFSVIVTLFAAAVMLALAVQRLISLGYLEASPTSNIILSFILYGLLAINNSLSAALTFSPGASGLIVLLYLISIVIINILPVLAFLADVLWRFLYVILDIVIWALLTPIIAIPYGIGKLFRMIISH
jgi:hypothetical protein